MERLREVLDRTWLVTVVFTVVSSAFWARLVAWGDVAKNVVCTVLIVPVVWHMVAGSRRPMHLMRATFAGALSGMTSQLAVQEPFIWSLIRAGFSAGAQGEDIAAGIEASLYILIGLSATVAGALLGLLVALVERRSLTRRNT